MSQLSVEGTLQSQQDLLSVQQSLLATQKLILENQQRLLDVTYTKPNTRYYCKYIVELQSSFGKWQSICSGVITSGDNEVSLDQFKNAVKKYFIEGNDLATTIKESGRLDSFITACNEVYFTYYEVPSVNIE